MKHTLSVVAFVLGIAVGAYIWNGYGLQIKSMFSDNKLTPEQEIQRIMDCLEMGKYNG